MSYNDLTKGRYSAHDMEYHVTAITHTRTAFFLDPNIANSFCQTLQSLIAEQHLSTLCWVLMPDHFHLLLRIQEKQNLAATVQLIKGRSARSCNRVMQRLGKLWQRGFYEHTLRKEEDRLAIAKLYRRKPIASQTDAKRRRLSLLGQHLAESVIQSQHPNVSLRGPT